MGEGYRTALAALQAAHDACFKADGRDVLGMTVGPFSGVNVALGVIAALERENESLRAIHGGMLDAFKPTK